MWLRVEILYVLSDKYYEYIFIYLYDDLQILVICYLSYDVQWCCFWGCGLSTERVVTHPLHLSLFPPGVKVLDIIEIAAILYSYT